MSHLRHRDAHQGHNEETSLQCTQTPQCATQKFLQENNGQGRLSRSDPIWGCPHLQYPPQVPQVPTAPPHGLTGPRCPECLQETGELQARAAVPWPQGGQDQPPQVCPQLPRPHPHPPPAPTLRPQHVLHRQPHHRHHQ